LLLVVAAILAAVAAVRPPSFVFILTDDQDLLLGGTAAQPVLHRELVAAGTALAGYVDVPVCCPSRTSTLSSRYSHNLNNTELGWCGDFHAVHENHTWVGALRASGYQTAIFGKYTNDYSSLEVEFGLTLFLASNERPCQVRRPSVINSQSIRV
jgi:arylsulfatase A-like enzyme